MDQQSVIYDELKDDYPVLAGIGKMMPYSIPENYFHQFITSILEKLEVEESSLPAYQDIYQVPEGYFDQLASNVLLRIKENEGQNEVEEELGIIAPSLLKLSKNPVFSLPQGYFDQNNFTDIAKSKNTLAPVFSIHKARKWMQYAAAAVVTGILVFSAFMFTYNNTTYKSFEQYNQLDIPSALNSVSDEALETYLNNPEQQSLSIAITELEELPLDINTPIQNLSDDELTQYLNDNSEAKGSVVIEKK